MSLVVFGRFDAKPGMEDELQKALVEIIAPTRAEPGCEKIHLHRGLGRRRGRFVVHATWESHAAFDAHAETPHMTRFLAGVDDLISHPLDVTRCEVIA